MGFSAYPFKEIEEKQRLAWGKPQAPPELPEPTAKHCVLPLTSPENGADSFTELRRFVIADLHARFQRLLGSLVLFPPSWNGLSEEIEARARQAGAPPEEMARRDREALRGALRELAVSLDPEAEVDLGESRFYRWSQWLFLELFKRRLLVRRCPPLPEKGTDPPSERTPGVQEGRWFVDLSSFGDRLLNDLDRTNWPAQEKKDQRYRIGRRRGCEVIFQVSHSFRLESEELPIFTTSVESLYGATFILIDPRHPILPAVLDPSYEEDVTRYRDRLAKGSEPRISGARTGGYAINPANLKRIPVLVSALAMDQFSGSVMGVPAHDPLLFELAQRLHLPIREAIRGPGSRYDVKGQLKEAYTGDGTLTNSSIFSGLPVRVARERMIAYLARRGICRRMTRFRIQEVPISRSGSRGVPVPVIHCRRCGEVPVSEETLPLILPPGGDPASRTGAASGHRPGPSDPGKAAKPLPVSCPICSGEGVRDPQFLSPWLSEAIASLEAAAVLQSSAGEFRAEARPEAGSAASVQEGLPGQTPAAGAAAGEAQAAGGLVVEPAPEEAVGPDGAGVRSARKLPAPGEAWEPLPGKATGVEEEAAEEDLPPPPSAEGGEAGEEELLPEDRDVFTPGRPHVYGGGRIEDEDGAVKAQGSPAGADGNEPRAGAPGVAEEAEEDDDEDLEQRPEAPAKSRFHPFRNESVKRWLPVDAAFARADQGVLFLLFIRSVTKFLNEVGEIPFQEPFYRYLRLGRVGPPTPHRDLKGRPAAAEERKPAAGTGKVAPGTPPAKAAPPPLSPSEAIQRHGGDAVRIALIGLTSPNRPGHIDEHAVWCARRFLGRIWRQVNLRLERGKFVSRALLESKHRLIHNVTQRLKRFKFHTALTSIHEFLNFLENPSTTLEEMDRSALRTFLVVLWPFAPHMAGELWSRIGETGSIGTAAWPEANKELLRAPEREVPVRLENRIVSRLKAPAGLEGEKLEALAMKDERVQAAIAGRPVGRVIAVADRTVNILLQREPEGKAPAADTAAGPPVPGAARGAAPDQGPGSAATPRSGSEISGPAPAAPPVPAEAPPPATPRPPSLPR